MSKVYITRDMAGRALNKMHGFNQKLSALYQSEGLDIKSDIGRRNILMSSIQEREFSKELSLVFDGVVNDGRSGQPDIVIGELDTELECKLTSPHGGKVWALQCDYATLAKKGSLDFLYMLVDRDFEEAAVLYFKGLTTEDFHPPASGSRGKSRMKKSIAMKKCTPLYGGIIDKNQEIIDRANEILKNKKNPPYQKKKALERITNWGRKEKQYSFKLEKIVGNG
jgi:hypothetical protein